jgi:hypothetical protein
MMRHSRSYLDKRSPPVTMMWRRARRPSRILLRPSPVYVDKLSSISAATRLLAEALGLLVAFGSLERRSIGHPDSRLSLVAARSRRPLLFAGRTTNETVGSRIRRQLRSYSSD